MSGVTFLRYFILPSHLADVRMKNIEVKITKIKKISLLVGGILKGRVKDKVLCEQHET